MQAAELLTEKRIKLQWPILFALGCGYLITSFESSAVVSLLPTINGAFHSNIDMAKWIVTLYLLTLSSLLLAAGRVGDMFGHRRLYLTGLATSCAGAILCALAPSMEFLALFRVVSAIGAVLILASAAALITKLTLPERRGYMLGLLSTAAYLGLIMGPAFSGLLSNAFGWRAVFFTVAMLALFGLIVGVQKIPSDSRNNVLKQINILQTLLIAVSLGVMTLAFHFSARLGWQSVPTLACLAVLIIALVIVRIDSKVNSKSNKYIAVLGNRQIALAAITATLTYVSLYSVIFILPFYLSGPQELSPVKIGFILSVRPTATALLAPLSGRLTDRFGSHIFNIIGLSLLLLALIILAGVFGRTQIAWIILSLAGIGMGMGIFLPPNHKLIMSSVSPADRGVASAVLSLTRNVGMLIGASVGSAFYSTKSNHTSSVFNTSNLGAHTVFQISAYIAGVSLCLLIVNSFVIHTKKIPFVIDSAIDPR